MQRMSDDTDKPSIRQCLISMDVSGLAPLAEGNVRGGAKAKTHNQLTCQGEIMEHAGERCPALDEKSCNASWGVCMKGEALCL